MTTNQTTERIILSVEIVQDGKDERLSMLVPNPDSMESESFGRWVEYAIEEMRNECKAMLKEKGER